MTVNTSCPLHCLLPTHFVGNFPTSPCSTHFTPWGPAIAHFSSPHPHSPSYIQKKTVPAEVGKQDPAQEWRNPNFSLDILCYLYQFYRTAITKYHVLGPSQTNDLNNKNLFSHSSEVYSSKLRCQQGCAPSETRGRIPPCVFLVLMMPSVLGVP